MWSAHVPDKLVATGVAARELGINRFTLVRWQKAGMVTPAFVTAGGHARWDLEDLKRQLEAARDGHDRDV